MQNDKPIPRTQQVGDSLLFFRNTNTPNPQQVGDKIVVQPWEGCTLEYTPNFIGTPLRDQLMGFLSMVTTWHEPKYKLYGKIAKSKTSYVWIGDKSYAFSKNHVDGCPATSWEAVPNCVHQLLGMVNERFAGRCTFNAVLITSYQYNDVEDAKLGWHSDDDAWLLPTPATAIVPCVTITSSSKAESWFGLQPKDQTMGSDVFLLPKNKSLYVMEQGTQLSSRHCVLKTLNPQGLAKNHRRKQRRGEKRSGTRYAFTFRSVNWDATGMPKPATIKKQ